MTAIGVRARVRAEMTEEIKTVARRHLVTDGANLSLRAVARDMGMASSAVYRYFASRDELLTALIIDAYNSLGERAEAAAGRAEGAAGQAKRAGRAKGAADQTERAGRAEGATAQAEKAAGQAEGAEHQAETAAGRPERAREDGRRGLDRFLDLTHAVREWALADPHRWALIYGSPVPGYEAPLDTIGPATRVVLLIAAVVRDAYENGEIEEREPITGRYADELAVVGERFTPGAPPRLVGAAMSAFIHLSGAVSAELFGQLKNSVDDDRRGFFEFQMRGAAQLIGLR